jgi:hypothetical protein
MFILLLPFFIMEGKDYAVNVDVWRRRGCCCLAWWFLGDRSKRIPFPLLFFVAAE